MIFLSGSDLINNYELVKSVNYDELDYFRPSYNTEEIDINTLCQYTGLKDKNGVEIYENDILQLFDTINEPREKVTIKWNNESACYEVLQLNGNHYSFDVRAAINPCEVIGNIFDNSELLEKSDKQ